MTDLEILKQALDQCRIKYTLREEYFWRYETYVDILSIDDANGELGSSGGSADFKFDKQGNSLPDELFVSN